MKFDKSLALCIAFLMILGSLSISFSVGSTGASKEENIAGEEVNMASNDSGNFTLVIDSTDGGSVFEPGEGTFTYDPGEKVNLTALPWSSIQGSNSDEKVYEFKGWTGDNETIEYPSAKETYITMDDNYSIKAEFTPQFDIISYDLTINIDGEGTTDPEEGDHTIYFIEEGENKITVEVEPADGWSFEEWTGDYNSTEEKITITMESDMEITAHLEEEEMQPLFLILAVAGLAGVIIFIVIDAKKH